MKNESNANGGPRIGPADPRAFLVDVLIKGVGRCVFYWLVIYLALVCGCLSAAQSADLAALRSSIIALLFHPFIYRSIIIALLFIPFIYLYSVPFEVAKKEHFPDPVIGMKKYFIGPYAILGWFALVLTAPFISGLYLSWRDGLLPVQAYPICIFLPYTACQILYASRYRLLQEERSETLVNGALLRGVLFAPLFYIPHVYLFLATAIAMIPSLFYDLLGPLETTVEAVLLIAASVGVILLGDFCARKNWKLGNRALFEHSCVREPIALFSTLVTPFFLGRASAIHLSGQHLSYFRLPLPDISILFTIFAAGLVFELLRYFADWPAYASRQEWPEKELHRQFQNSVTHYFYIYVSVICCMPFLLFLGGARVWYLGLVAVAVYVFMTVGAGCLRPYSKMGFDRDPGTKVFGVQPPTILVGLKVVGYVTFLVTACCIYAASSDPVPKLFIRDPVSIALCGIPCAGLLGALLMPLMVQFSLNNSSFRLPSLIAALPPLVICLLCLFAVAYPPGEDPSGMSADLTVSHRSMALVRAEFTQGAVELSWIYVAVAVFVLLSIGLMLRAFEPPGEQLRADLFSKLPCRDILSGAEKRRQDARTTANGVAQPEQPIGPGEKL